MSASSRGYGPGVQAPDGCSVELYRRIPYFGELEGLLPLLAPRGRVLELGCGTGRLGARLADAGFRVTGVDNCSEMLAALPPTIRAIESDIEALSLPHRFDVVLLAGSLINTPDLSQRTAFLAVARRHLDEGGRLLIQRHSPEWLRTASAGSASHVATLSINVDEVRREAGLVHMTLRYVIDDQAWLHVFTAAMIDEAQIDAMLKGAGFAAVTWHGDEHTWATAVAG